MNGDLLVNYKREASTAFGILRPDTFFSKRLNSLVDTIGIIRGAYLETTAGTKRENARILDAIRAVADSLNVRRRG